MKSNKNVSQETAKGEAAGPAATGQFALEMMHEVRNSLEALNNLLHLGLTTSGLEEVRRYIHLAQEQVAALSEIANTSLGFARSLHTPRPTCLVRLVEAAIRTHRALIDAKRIQLIKDLPDGLVVEVRGGEILQVVSNLVTNALDALPSGGTLRVRLRVRALKVHLLVVDNGTGIPKAILNRIFEPFFTTKMEAGTGLGLAFSKRIVQDHGGKIRLRSSVRPGKSGSLFEIILPLEKSQLSGRSI